MSDIKYDEYLNIKSVGSRDWLDKLTDYNRYEATPYRALDQLFKSYTLEKTDKLIDFGCGRGRVAFYTHNRFKIPVKGIEANIITFDEALKNKANYRLKTSHINTSIDFEYCPAENYKVNLEDNRFYFFNPFSVRIFKQVINNILESVKIDNRCVDVILYYPTFQYINFLEKATSFKLINETVIPKTSDKAERFLIYRINGNT